MTPEFYARAERIWGPLAAEWEAALASRFTALLSREVAGRNSGSARAALGGGAEESSTPFSEPGNGLGPAQRPDSVRALLPYVGGKGNQTSCTLTHSQLNGQVGLRSCGNNYSAWRRTH